jgi:molybdopterin/thiamine biosynthesis adenylyltransferase
MIFASSRKSPPVVAPMTEPATLRLESPPEHRFSRFEAIKWWRQERLRGARVLVIGAGALGNEVIKNLALLGVGQVVIADMDRIEQSNLSRSVLFRESDEGRYKADTAAAAASALYPPIRAVARRGNILAQLGLGWFRWAEVVVGALDNREARVFVNRACAQVGRPWIDGGIDVLNGIVRAFAPPETACYECTMGQADWDLLAKRRSCALLARNAYAEGGAPTTPTTASIIGAIQAQEVVKRLHGLESLAGRGFVFEGLNHTSFTVNYPIAPDCPWHETPAPVQPFPELNSDTPLSAIWHKAAQTLGALDALDLSREIVAALECPACHAQRPIRRPIELVLPEEVPCPACRTECTPGFCHSLAENSPLLSLTPRQLGLPEWDILWARGPTQTLGLELGGDFPAELA